MANVVAFLVPHGTRAIRARRHLAIALVLALAALLLGAVLAEGSFSTPRNLSAPGQSAVGPQVAVDSSGRATVVWQRSDGVNSRIQTRRIAADGTLEPIQTLSAAGESASDPQVAVDSSGGVTVVWERLDGAGNLRIQARQVAANGTLEPVQTLSAAGEDGLHPQVAVNPGGKATVAWEWLVSPDQVQARQIAADGTLEPIKTVAAAGDGPQVAADSSGRATIAWTNGKVQARRVASDGTLEPVQTLSTSGGGPQAAVDSSDRVTVVWTHSDGGNNRAQARRIGADGTTLGPVQTLSGAGQDIVDPEVAIDSSNRATVVWTQTPRFAATGQVQARRIAADGDTLGPLHTLSGDEAIENQVAVNADGRATVVWVRFFRPYFRVQSRRIAADGTTLGSVQTLSDAGEDALDPEVVARSDEATVVWDRSDGANTRIQASQGS
ncbi:MAG TPA: hypothetical protein VH391_11190 [Solirubrobacterales bacterium]